MFIQLAKDLDHDHLLDFKSSFSQFEKKNLQNFSSIQTNREKAYMFFFQDQKNF